MTQLSYNLATMTTSTPLNQLKNWLHEERAAGAPKPLQAVLSTIGANDATNGRVVAIREMDELSDVYIYTLAGDIWVKQWLSS